MSASGCRMHGRYLLGRVALVGAVTLAGCGGDDTAVAPYVPSVTVAAIEIVTELPATLAPNQTVQLQANALSNTGQTVPDHGHRPMPPLRL
jgi:multidrug efflux pump subunit AcrA (membrane-fusion protein)